MIAHLSKPEYVHVLLNPLPVYGLAVGVLGPVITFLLRTRAARVTAFALVMLSAASARDKPRQGVVASSPKVFGYARDQTAFRLALAGLVAKHCHEIIRQAV